jgi:hypothetical protein
MFPPEPEGYRPKVVQHTMYLNDVSLDAAQSIVDAIESSDASLRAVQLRTLGGAMARVPADATAFGYREAKVMAVIVNFFDSEAEIPKRRAWVADLRAKLDDGTPGAYVNFVTDQPGDAARDGYPPATWSRLVEIKRRYDPTNVFHVNQNIPPGG